MNIHVLISKEVSSSIAEGLPELLKEVGPMTFKFPKKYEVDFGDAEVLTWKELFDACAGYRSANNFPRTDLIIVVTDIPNQNNWFSAMDFNNTTHGFVHAGDWELYLESEPVYPIAYQMVALVLHKYLTYDEPDKMEERVHLRPIGCVSDMNANKRDVSIQLRAADICTQCLAILTPKIGADMIGQSLRIFNSIRSEMLTARNFLQNLPLSVIKVTGSGRLLLMDNNEIDIKLSPIQKTLYIFFLYRNEEMHISKLADYREDLNAIYNIVDDWEKSNDDDAVKAGLMERHEAVDKITNALEERNGSANYTISKLNKKIGEMLGSALGKSYFLKNKVRSGPYSIALPEELVDMDRDYWRSLIKQTIIETKKYL